MTANSRISLSSRLFALLCTVGILLPILLAADFIHRYGVNALLFDDFEYLTTLGDVLQGRLPVAEWLKPH